MIDDGLTVAVIADYNNHFDWSSPIGVADFFNWQSVYGISIIGTAIDKNDGTMTGSLIIKRAGAYTLSITVNGAHIKGSPHYPLKVKPTSLHAPSCVAVEIPDTMYSGFDYSFLIQGRDMYHNNIVDLISDAVGTDYSIVYTLISDSTVKVNAKISDDSALGVFIVKVRLPKKLKEGDYSLKILLGGAETPSPAILIKPCTNRRAF